MHSPKTEGADERVQPVHLRRHAVVERRVARRLTEAGEVGRDDPEMAGEVGRDPREIVFVAPETVHEHQRLAGAAVEIGDIQTPDCESPRAEPAGGAGKGEPRLASARRPGELNRGRRGEQCGGSEADDARWRHIAPAARNRKSENAGRRISST